MDTIHFYGTSDPYGFLSNFLKAPMVLDGSTWPTVEHYYQAQKFADPAKQAAIRAAPTPGVAKQLAWAPDAGFRADWDAVRDEVMLTAIRAKFTQHPDLRAQLLATGDTWLAEHTTKDHYWADGGDGSGQNQFGRLLMQVRSELKAQAVPSVNQVVLDWLFDAGKIDLRRSARLELAPPLHAAPVPWERVEGMLLGLAIGDALGNTSESKTPPERRMRYGEIRDYLPDRHAAGAAVGLPSDDSQLAFWLLEQLNADGELLPEQLARRFTRQQIFGIGSTVQKFLVNYKEQGLPWYDSGVHSAGNGALMRIAPILLPHLRAPSNKLWVDTALAAMVTHNDAASTAACLAFVAMLWELLGRTTPPPPTWWLDTYVEVARDLEGETTYAPRGGNFLGYRGPLWRYVAERVGDAFARDVPVLEACEAWHSGAYLMETVPCLLYILMRHGNDPETAIVRAVNDTRDNDTIAALVGAAVGALHGAHALPARWQQGLLGPFGCG